MVVVPRVVAMTVVVPRAVVLHEAVVAVIAVVPKGVADPVVVMVVPVLKSVVDHPGADKSNTW